MTHPPSHPSFVEPPGGLGHLAVSTADLLRHRVRDRESIVVTTALQPNAPPHLGTLCLLSTVFAVAEHIAQAWGLPASVTVDLLENSPGRVMRIGERVWARSLEDVFDEAGASIAQVNAAEYERCLGRLSQYSGVPYRIRWYREFQSLPAFRRGLLRVLREPEVFAPVLSPSEGRIRLRTRCPECMWSEKSAQAVTATVGLGGLSVTAECWTHGPYEERLTISGEGYVDTNTPLRSVLKGLVLIDEESGGVLSVSVDGADWGGSWYWRVYCEGLGLLGVPAARFTPQLFAPLVVDWSGAKLSKSVHVGTEAYRYLSPAVTDSRAFEEIYGDQGWDRLWALARWWASSPGRLFRSYSVEYLRMVLEGAPE